MLPRKEISTTIDAGSHAYLHKMVKTGRAESVGDAVDKAVEVARRLENRAALERQTAAYFAGLTATASAEETDLEEVLSAASEEVDFDKPKRSSAARRNLDSHAREPAGSPLGRSSVA